MDYSVYMALGQGVLRLHESMAREYSVYTELWPGTTQLTRNYGRGLLSLHGTRAGDYSVYMALIPGSTPYSRI